ncbi:MAG: hypothetical protein E7665_02225 [Ruminococcaceae bacterium]|nr:hypothetical protein [Oscillospiraceae bacterium]
MKNENILKMLKELQKSNIDELNVPENVPAFSSGKEKEILKAMRKLEKERERTIKALACRRSSRFLRRLPAAIVLVVLLASTLIMFSGAFFESFNTDFNNSPYILYDAMIIDFENGTAAPAKGLENARFSHGFTGYYHRYGSMIALTLRREAFGIYPYGYNFYGYNIETNETFKFDYVSQETKNFIFGNKNKFYALDSSDPSSDTEQYFLVEFDLSDGSSKKLFDLPKKTMPEHIHYTTTESLRPFAADDKYIYSYIDYEGIYRTKLDGSKTELIYRGFVYHPEKCANGYIYFESMDAEIISIGGIARVSMNMYRIPMKGGKRELFCAPLETKHFYPWINKETGYVYYRSVKEGTEYLPDDFYVVREPGKIELLYEVDDDIHIDYSDARTHEDYVYAKYRTITLKHYHGYRYSEYYPELIVINGKTGEVKKIALPE